MFYPPGWRRIQSDSGTASAALIDRHKAFLGYLNITPRQGHERIAGWGRFRVRHNVEENDRFVRMLAVSTVLQFRSGRGACVKDAYTTTTGDQYVELACLVAGRRSSTVIVGATPPKTWSQISPLLERAISSMTT
jgi:hypothetical protein